MWSPDEVLRNIEEDSIRDRIAHSPERYTRDGAGLHELRSGAAVSLPTRVAALSGAAWVPAQIRAPRGGISKRSSKRG